MAIPFAEVKVLDRNAEALGISTGTLMENAGRAVAARVREISGPEGVLVLAGPGNNGGDALVAARLLAEADVPVRVLMPVARSAVRSPIAQAALASLPPGVSLEAPAPLESLARELARPGLVVDGLLGVGVHGALREPFRSWVAKLAEGGRRVVSVDVPSGLGTDTTFVPDETVTLHDVKEGMTERNSGRIRVADIGIPAEASRYTGPGEYALYPQGRWDQHKGEGGIVLVIGGGPYTGAPAVAGLAALRAGADLAIVLTPKRAWSVIAGYSPNLVVRPLNGDELDFDDPANRVTLNAWLKKARSVVVGPGLGLFDLTQRSVAHVVERAQKENVPVVLDADAITALAAVRKEHLGARAIVTPHAAEFRALTGRDLPPPADLEARAEAARLAASAHEATWLVKGPVDVITDGSRVKLNATGHPAMSVGGTGDALAGIAGALLAKGLAPFDAARLAARISGEAGAEAARTKSWGLLATDVVEAIPQVLVRSLPSVAELKQGIQ